MPFFALTSPRDMLEKARREYQRLGECFDIDNVFNFFVTAYHIRDYIRKTRAVKPIVLEKFLQDQDIKYCRMVCNKGKHLVLEERDKVTNLVSTAKDPNTIVWSGCIGGAPLNALPIGGGDKWVLISGSREIDIKWLAKRVLAKWEKFFEDNRL